MTLLGVTARRELFRAVNERILDLSPRGFGAAELICECADESCTSLLTIMPEEFDAMRSQRGVYAVLPGHEHPGRDEVLESTDTYVVVRPLPATAEVAAK
jgi:hypothetical protein